ncbi:MAG: hypothetical protein RIR94_1570, partial [Bacteroidota bacterium]
MKPKDPSQFRILLMGSYPPRECGIATYSHDLRKGLVEKFGQNCQVDICALENSDDHFEYPKEVTHTLKVDLKSAYIKLAQALQLENTYDAILIAHEFGLFGGAFGQDLLLFLKANQIPVILNFHTVLPAPCAERYTVVNDLIHYASAVVCMTKASADLLLKAYVCPKEKCIVIAHGTALVAQRNNTQLKIQLGLAARPVLTTFGLLSRGKSIETALYAMALVKEKFPNSCYVILGKTHPEVAKQEGECYRNFLIELSQKLDLTENIRFVDAFVDNQLLEDYLQATDIYLFTSSDPNQAVSGTFAYAMACGCPIVSTPIPQAKDALGSAGMVVEFNEPQQMAQAITHIFDDAAIHAQMQQAAFQQSKPSAWPNVALQYMRLIEKINPFEKKNKYFELPQYNLNHLKNCTTPTGLIQFCTAEQPLLASGYTLDDNARALIGLVEYYAIKPDHSLLKNIGIHFDFIERMQLASGRFINYLDYQEKPSPQNINENLDDANGRAIWALGTMAALQHMFNPIYLAKIHYMFHRSMDMLQNLESPRALAFSIKGLIKYNEVVKDKQILLLVAAMAKKLERLYMTHRSEAHHWFEPKLTYANAVLPEALLLASQISQNRNQQESAHQSFNYLLDLLFKEEQFNVISNRTWYAPGQENALEGQQPIDVSYTILALSTFYQLTNINAYLLHMKTAFDWYLGKNSLNQIVYNPISGGCLDGLEANEVNINQGA